MKRITILRQIKEYIIKQKMSAIFLVFVSLISVPLAFITPKVFQIFIDDVLDKKNIRMFGAVVIALIGIYIARLILDTVNLHCSNKLLNSFTFSIRKNIWLKYTKISFLKYESMNFGDLKMRFVDDVDSLGGFLKSQVVDYVCSLLLAVISLGLTLYINAKMTLICIGIIPVIFLISHFIGTGLGKVNEEIRQVNDRYYSFTHNSLQFWRETKAHNAEGEFISRFKSFRKTLAKLGYKNIRFWFFSEIFNDFKSNYLSKVFIYIVGAFFVANGELSVGMLMMYAEYFAMLFNSLDAAYSKNVEIKMSMPYYKRIFEVLSLRQKSECEKLSAAIKGDIEIKNVSFSYNSNQQVLNNIDLKIIAGEYLAIIGKSGCGKTTLAKLLLCLYEPTGGEILLDGINISKIKSEVLHSQIAVVMQDSYFFNSTIRENLYLAKENASDEELLAACRQANILEFIESLPLKLDTVIGERGVKLSGGQKQRLSIARAVLRDAKIIILDEATSSLDKISEDYILDSLHKISNSRTIILISHKPSAMSRADKLVIMDEGGIVAYGTHSQLIKTNEFYGSLVNGL